MNSTKNKRKAGRIDMKGTQVGRVLGPKSVYVRPVVLLVSSMGRVVLNGFTNHPRPGIVV